MNSSEQGFTLIELLMVIAIIGIISSVLLPNMLNVRSTATARSGQAHSANVYKALAAALADETRQSANAILLSYTSECNTVRTVDPANKVPFGWSPPPRGIKTCKITESHNDFVVTVTMDASGRNKIFVNGFEN